MSSLQKTHFKKILITPRSKISALSTIDKAVESLDITPAVVSFDYYEDILSAAITVDLKISNTSALYSLVPIRGGERVDLVIGTAYGDITFGEEDKNELYVLGIEGLTQNEGQEIFTLKLCTLGNLTNETARCQVRFPKRPISSHIRTILEQVMEIKPERIALIEDSTTSYGFIGNNRKPFYTCTWLCPKAIPSTEGVKGDAGNEAKGTAGFCFYENYDGYNFRSVDRMVDATQVEYPDDTTIDKLASEYGVETYTFSSVISTDSSDNEKQIIHAFTDKTTNLQKNLRVGLYSNLTYFYNPLDWSTKAIPHKLKDELNKDGVKVSGKDVPIPAGDVSEAASRVLVRVGDKGMLAPTLETNQDDNVDGSGRSDSDMAKAFSRYTLLFQQSLNITVPCNINLRAGDIIKVQVPESGPNDNENKNLDQELSGFYLIRSLRHHFEISEGSNVTSLNLIRDSFGLT